MKVKITNIDPNEIMSPFEDFCDDAFSLHEWCINKYGIIEKELDCGGFISYKISFIEKHEKYGIVTGEF